MKVISIPSSGACGRIVAYVSPFGQVHRERVLPRNTPSPARDFMRGAFGHHSQAYSRELTPAQRDRWCYAGSQVMSHPRLAQCGPLSGQQLHEKLNCVLSRVGLPALSEPPAPPMFSLNPVGGLEITHDEGGVRLLLRVTGELSEPIMVFGQAPCSAGRHKRRNVCYLGLLPPAIGGTSDITYLYRARFGEPRPGTKVFIVTCQQRDGWKGTDHVTSDMVPERAAGRQAAYEAGDSQKPLMHKGSTRGEQGTGALSDSALVGGDGVESRGGKAVKTAIGGEGGGGGTGVSPGRPEDGAGEGQRRD